MPELEPDKHARDRPPATVEGAAPLIVARSLTMRFGATLALDHVDFDLATGEIHALLGANGAGKSTLIKILAGVHEPDEGEVRVNGEPVDPTRQKLPIAFIHQELGLVEAATVAENIALVAGYARSNGLISWSRVRARAADILASVAHEIDPDSLVASLPAAERSLVAIARALALRADAVVLDEPTAALPESDVTRLFDALSGMRRSGIGIVYVTHRLDEVYRLADRVTVLRDGRSVFSAPVRETTADQLVYEIVGRALADVEIDIAPQSSAQALVMEDVVADDGVGPVSLEVAPGEILGLVGLRGAGHHTVGRLVFGDSKLIRGTMLLDGIPYRPRSVRDAIRQRVGFVSSRREEGLAPGLSVRENLFMNPGAESGSKRAVVSRRAERTMAQELATRFSITPPDTERPVATLSGGNQQKVLLARWLGSVRRLLVLEDPTFGVDVGSKASIYQMLAAFAKGGGAVLLISSDFEEVARVCHRSIVFSRGRVVAELPGALLSIERVTAAAGGAGQGNGLQS